MPKFKITFSRPELQYNAFIRRLKETSETQVRQAARAFVREAIKKIPVLTGEARGSLLPLGNFLRVAIPINPSIIRQGRDETSGSGPDKQFLFKFANEGSFFYFELKPQLFHFWWNEFFTHPEYKNAQVPPPWNSYQDGKDAFFQYLHENFKFRAKDVSKFILLDASQPGGTFGG